MPVTKTFEVRERTNELGQNLVQILEDGHVSRVFAGATREEALGKMHAAGYKECLVTPVWKRTGMIPPDRCTPLLSDEDKQIVLAVFPRGTRAYDTLKRLCDEGGQRSVSYDVQVKVNQTFANMLLPYRIYVAKGRILAQFNGAEVAVRGFYYLFKGQMEEQEGAKGS